MPVSSSTKRTHPRPAPKPRPAPLAGGGEEDYLRGTGRLQEQFDAYVTSGVGVRMVGTNTPPLLARLYRYVREFFVDKLPPDDVLTRAVPRYGRALFRAARRTYGPAAPLVARALGPYVSMLTAGKAAVAEDVTSFWARKWHPILRAKRVQFANEIVHEVLKQPLETLLKEDAAYDRYTFGKPNAAYDRYAPGMLDDSRRRERVAADPTAATLQHGRRRKAPAAAGYGPGTLARRRAVVRSLAESAEWDHERRKGIPNVLPGTLKQRDLRALVERWTGASSGVQKMRASRASDRWMGSDAAVDAALARFMSRTPHRAPSMPPGTPDAETTFLYRGIWLRDRRQLAAILKNKRVEKMGFVAMSTDPSVAAGMAGVAPAHSPPPPPPPPKGAPPLPRLPMLFVKALFSKDPRRRGAGLVVRVRRSSVPKGTPWIWFGSRHVNGRVRSYMPQEKEVLLPPGHFDLVARMPPPDAKASSRTHWFDATYVPDTAASAVAPNARGAKPRFF